jgi:hypothetical protein
MIPFVNIPHPTMAFNDPLIAIREHGKQWQHSLTHDKLLAIQSDHANWLIPGKLACGPYPGLDGVNFPNLEAAQTHLQNLVADGINTFVCMQSEYTTLCQQQPHPYFPQFEDYMHTAKQRLGITNLTQFHFSIPDQETPSSRPTFVAQLRSVCDAMCKGAVVYVHCAGGHGRAGLFVSCLLAAIFNSPDPDYIMTYVQRMHDARRAQDARCKGMLFVQSPKTPTQRAFVRDFITYLRFL